MTRKVQGEPRRLSPQAVIDPDRNSGRDQPAQPQPNGIFPPSLFDTSTIIFIEHVIYGQFAEVIERFSGALGPRLPHLSREEAFWRFHFMVGAMSHTLHVIADWRNLEALFPEVPEPSQVDEVVGRLVTFLAAGFRTPIPAQEHYG